MRTGSSKFSPFWQIVYTVVPYGFTFESNGFGAVYYSLSIGIEETDHPMILIYYFVGNVSDCGNHSSRNSAFNDRYL